MIVIADDTVPEPFWDSKIAQYFAGKDAFEPIVLITSDMRCTDKIISQTGDDLLPRHPIFTRDFYDQCGYVFDPNFYGAGCDNQLLLIGLREGFLRDFRSFKIHHTKGDILTDTGKLNCGCEDSKKTSSQNQRFKSVHDDTSTSKAQSELSKWGFTWRFIELLASSPNTCNAVFYAYQNLALKNGYPLTPGKLLSYIALSSFHRDNNSISKYLLLKYFLRYVLAYNNKL